MGLSPAQKWAGTERGVLGLGSGVPMGLGSWVWGPDGSWVWGLGSRRWVWGLGSGVPEIGSKVSGLGSRWVWGLKSGVAMGLGSGVPKMGLGSGVWGPEDGSEVWGLGSPKIALVFAPLAYCATILLGFRMFFGSNARLMAAMSARLAGFSESARYGFLAKPMPCSPETCPPRSRALW